MGQQPYLISNSSGHLVFVASPQYYIVFSYVHSFALDNLNLQINTYKFNILSYIGYLMRIPSPDVRKQICSTLLKFTTLKVAQSVQSELIVLYIYLEAGELHLKFFLLACKFFR